jgi:hypothetical protein
MWNEREALLEKSKLEKKLFIVSGQLAPYIDRFGRCLMDSSPHFAMFGHNLGQTIAPHSFNILPPTAPSYTSSYGRPREQEAADPIARFLDPMSLNRNHQVDSNNLSAVGRHLSFEVPVILNPGELMSTNSRQSSYNGENNIHLHINAQVHMPSTTQSNPAAENLERVRRRERDVRKTDQTTQTKNHAQQDNSSVSFDSEAKFKSKKNGTGGESKKHRLPSKTKKKRVGMMNSSSESDESSDGEFYVPSDWKSMDEGKRTKNRKSQGSDDKNQSNHSPVNKFDVDDAPEDSEK